MHTPTLRQLQFLCALADHGSFSRAAEVSLVAQPTLSASIKDVEALLGVQLFERIARGARPTKAGEIAIDRARQILADAQDLVATVREASAPLSGSFRLGAIPTIAPFILPQTLKRLRKDYPSLALYLREEKTADLLDALRARRLDAAIIALPWETPGMETMVIADDAFILAYPDGHEISKLPKLTQRQLRGENLLLLEEGHCMRGHALSVCSLPDVQRTSELAATSLQTMVQMVSGGLGVSLIPDIAVKAGLTRGIGVKVRAFSGTVPGRQIAICWRSRSSSETEARLIGEIITGLLGRN